LAKFVFNLEAVLRQKAHIEKEKQRELALIQRQMTDLQAELRALNDSVQTATGDIRDNHLVGKLDMQFLAAHRRFMAATQRKGTEIVQRMALVQKQVDQAQRALAEAAKNRKAMEKLKERAHERWKTAMNHKEFLAADELNTQMSYFAGLTQAQSDAELQALHVDETGNLRGAGA
jgi:flagellar export protein FliJ